MRRATSSNRTQHGLESGRSLSSTSKPSRRLCSKLVHIAILTCRYQHRLSHPPCHTAASYHLKNLESDSLPLISLAVQARMSALIEQMLAAKHYRTSANHLRPPPMLPVQYEGEVPTPMWDQVLHDDNEKILTTFDRVEREEERQARKSRLLRDQLEQAEKERLERLAEEGDDGGGDVSMKVEGGSGSVPGTPAAGGSGKGEPGKKEKKRKRETATQAARNMTEDVRKRLSDATASKKLGTKKFSWLASGTGLGGADSPSMRKKARIPPLPPSSLSISMTSLPTLGTSLQDGLDQPPLTAMERLAGVPAAHDASQIGSQDDPANRLVTIRDALFVMDQERGKGAGTGSGTRPTVRAMLGRV